MIPAVALVAWTALLLPAGNGPEDAPATNPTAAVRVLVLPVQARHGGSAYLGESVAQVLLSSLPARPGLEVLALDPMLEADGTSMALVRCVEVQCAVEMGKRRSVDEVIYGTLDGAADVPLLRLWRVSVAEGTVLGMFTQRMTDDAITRVVDDPTRMLLPLMDAQLMSQDRPRWAPLPAQKVVPVAVAQSRPGPWSRLRPDQPAGLGLRLAGATGLGASVVALASGVGLLAGVAALGVFGYLSAQQSSQVVVSTPVAVFLEGSAVAGAGLAMLALVVAGASCVAFTLPLYALKQDAAE